jgi:hypothetical protein
VSAKNFLAHGFRCSQHADVPDPLWTQDDIDKLKSAIASGVLSVSFGDQSTTFQSLKEMRALLADMVAVVSVSNDDGPPGYRLASVSKGV